jgi:hypothetical protein
VEAIGLDGDERERVSTSWTTGQRDMLLARDETKRKQYARRCCDRQWLNENKILNVLVVVVGVVGVVVVVVVVEREREISGLVCVCKL